MKNFPHQYNDFTKLRQTLATIVDLDKGGGDVSDDGVLGYELSRRGIYTFRVSRLSLRDRIALEQRKPTGSQGPRTAAREMRRTLRYLGWLGAGWQITADGSAFLATAAGSEEERAAWQRALLDLALEDDGDVSHPIRILLRLVGDNEIVARHGMELALEARDDSDAEYQRINTLMGLTEAQRIRRLRTTPYQVANAVKILPAFAEQANLIRRSVGSAPYTLTEAGRAALSEGFASRSVELRPAVRSTRTLRVAGAPRRVPGRRVRGGDVTRPTAGDPEDWTSLSHEEQIAATRLRFERTTRHQDLVGELIELLDADDVQLYVDTSSYDLLHVPTEPEPLTILEIKTLEADELTQTRLAVGQLFSYEHLNVRPRWEGRDIRRAVVFERPVMEELGSFLDAVAIAAFTLARGELTPLNATARESGLL